MFRDKEIDALQTEISDLRRKASEAHQALTQSNQTIKTSTELSDVERAWVTIFLAKCRFGHAPFDSLVNTNNFKESKRLK
jgi:hypothetical protein